MTLSVTAYRLHPDGSRTELPLPSNLAGFESTRADYYGAEAHQGLGLLLLPQLKNGDLHVRGADLAVLQADVELLLRNLPPDREGEYWRNRLDNIKAAVEAAMRYGDAGLVVID
jgi:hypothetical protein